MPVDAVSLSRSAVIILSAGLAWVGCAGPGGETDLGGADGGAASSGAVGTGAGNGAVGPASGLEEGGVPTGATDGGSGIVDAAVDAPHDAFVLPTMDAGPGGTTSALSCGTSTCALPGQLCCIAGPAAGPSYACVTGTSCPIVNPGNNPGSAALSCSVQSNCTAGLFCCLDIVSGQSVSTCKSSCAASPAQLCDRFIADNGCAVQKPCSNANTNDFGLPATYATCGGVKN